MSELKIGDVVELNSGSSQLTIVDFINENVIVVYFDENRQLFSQYKLHKDSVKLKEIK